MNHVHAEQIWLADEADRAQAEIDDLNDYYGIGKKPIDLAPKRYFADDIEDAALAVSERKRASRSPHIKTTKDKIQ